MKWAVQMAAMAAIVIAFAMQIPKSALFFRPVEVKEADSAPCAAFVTIDDAAYARLMRKVRTAGWPDAMRGWNEGSVSLGTWSLLMDDPPPPVPALPIPKAFTASPAPVQARLPPLRPPLKPPSLAMSPMPPLVQKAAAAPADEKRPADLLDLDGFESLKERK